MTAVLVAFLFLSAGSDSLSAGEPVYAPVPSDSVFMATDETGRNRFFTTGSARPVLALSGFLVSGTASVLLTREADNRYKAYSRTLNRKEYTQTRQLDRAAGVFLIASEVFLGWLVWELFSPPEEP